MKRILKFLGYALVTMTIAMGASVLLSSCEEFEGGLTRGCRCMKYENDTIVSSDYYDKKENGYRRVDGCLDMQNNLNRTAPKDIRYHCDPETQRK